MKRSGFRRLSLLVCVTILLIPFSQAAVAAPQNATEFPMVVASTAQASVSAASAVLLEAESGTVLYAKDAASKRAMASTTKIMTALLAVESGRLAETVTVDPRAAGTEGSSVYLYAGEKITLENLVYALMLASANDAAEAIAYAMAGGIDAFAAKMNARATELGLQNTHFVNPHGLWSEEHYTTAYDLARLTAAALQNEIFAEIVSTYRKTIPLESGSTYRFLINHNKLLIRYDGAIGVKTGFTKKSGRCLVSAAIRNGVTLVCVTLNAPDDWRDHTSLLDWGFSRCNRVTLAEAESLAYRVPVVGGTCDAVLCKNRDAFSCVIAAKEPEELSLIAVTELYHFYYAPVHTGDLLGETVFYLSGTRLGALPLYADADVPILTHKRSFREWLSDLLGTPW